MDVRFQPEFTEALEVLAAAFTAAVARGASQPVIVGGAAVDFYTAGGIQSADFDIVNIRDDIVVEELKARGFKEKYEGILRGLYRPELLMVVDCVSVTLLDGKTDCRRLTVAVVDPEREPAVSFPPVEGMIADRLGQYESVP